ncbi:MAG: FtsX-like permease family protein [Gammaproteobacteria bacterium]|nr:FtsX-like permease family protein [Gammaproteobacteria bacterium]
MIHAGIYKDVMAQAFHALRDNKLRTVLSILGIAIGISAVMIVGAITKGINDYIYKELNTYGLKSVWIYRDWDNDDPNRVIRQGSGIDNDDYNIITSHKCCPAIKRATAVVYSRENIMPVRAGNHFFNASIEGVDVDYTEINNDQLKAGRNFRKDDIVRRKTVAIISPKAAKNLYGSANPIGKTFRFSNKKFQIIGLLAEKNRDLLNQIGADSYDVNGRILIPYTSYQTYFGVKDIHTVQAEAYELERTEEALQQLNAMLQRTHNYKYKYKQESMQGWMDTADQVLASISLVGLLGAGISLLIGGMNIMNIMSTTVVERTREIGIRKALGAQNSDILFQFLMEAITVSAIGGIIGLSMGIVITYLVAWFSGFPLSPSWLMAFIAVAVSVVVGLISGFYPAHRAARLKPVEALRYG